MLSKCVNPACSTSFRYLHEGRVFRLERDPLRSDDSTNHAHGFEYFWLCPVCSSFLTVVYEDPVVKVQPLHHLLPPNSVRLITVETRRAH
jgi:hypothetical protein